MKHYHPEDIAKVILEWCEVLFAVLCCIAMVYIIIGLLACAVMFASDAVRSFCGTSVPM